MRRLYPDEWQRRGFVPLYGDPKYRLLYDFPIENSLIGCTTTWTGDTGHSITTEPRKPMQAFPLQPEEFVRVYQMTRDPRFAQAMAGPGASIPSELHDPELRREAEKIVEEHGWEVELRSNVLDGYGHAILRSGAGEHKRAFWLRYGRVKQHAHQDLLTMGLAALRRDMLPDLGYPQGWTYTSQWAANWGTHYAAHITGVPTGAFGRGRLTLFADTPPARVASAACAPVGGDGKTMQSRTIVLVDLSPEDCYAVTLHRVLGGEEHTLSFHGPDGEAVPIGLELTPQEGGTVLGPDVEYGQYSAVSGLDPELSCLAFMYDVARARPSGVWAIDYPLEDQDDVHLRMTMIAPEGCNLALAKGRPPQGNKSYEMTWAILQRTGSDPLASQFLTVLEPFQGERRIRNIEPVELSGSAPGRFEPVGIRITGEGFTDTIILQPDDPVECTTADGLTSDGEFSFWRERDGECLAAVLAGGTKLGKGDVRITLPQAAWRGRITSCDWKSRTLAFEPAPEDPGDLVGRHVQLSNDSGSHASYLIEAARTVEDGCQITLPLDPRIGEGFVAGCEDGIVKSATRLRFHNYWSYYAGKTIANEDASAMHRLRDVTGAVNCILDESPEGKIAAHKLRTEFADRDGDGHPRFVIYDYGPGDQVTIKNHATRSQVRPAERR